MMIAILLLITFILSAYFTAWFRHYLQKKNILDTPNTRSAHQIPTPRGGGLVFVIVFMLAITFCTMTHSISGTFFLALCGVIPVAVIGWLDDRKSLAAGYRLLIHFYAATWASFWLGGFPHLNIGTHPIALSFLSYPLAILGILWLINLYNFMDGIDGLASSEAVFISLSGALFMPFSISLVCLLLAAAVLGFLVHNWPPARLFMGDIGSGSLGFIFGVIALQVNNTTSFSFTIWVILASVFIADATYTFLYRLLRRQRVYVAHREHAYQLFLKKHVSHKTITLTIIAGNIFILLPLAYLTILYPRLDWIIASSVLLAEFLLWCAIRFL